MTTTSKASKIIFLSLRCIPQSATDQDIIDHWHFELPSGMTGFDDEVTFLQVVGDAVVRALDRMYPDPVERKSKFPPGFGVSKRNHYLYMIDSKGCAFTDPQCRYPPANIPMRRFLFFFLTCLLE
jgi:hypothetical protein